MLLKEDIKILSVVAFLNPFSVLLFYFGKGWKNSEFIKLHLIISIIFLTLSCLFKWKKDITWERAYLTTILTITILIVLIAIGLLISMGRAPLILIAE